MSVLVSLLITFLVVVLVLYLIARLPIDGRAKQIAQVIVIIIGIISLLRYLAVFSRASATLAAPWIDDNSCRRHAHPLAFRREVRCRGERRR